MNTEQLYKGQVFKNYKHLCEVLGLEVKNGANSKDAQFKELARYSSYEKIGHKITIKDIYENPLPKIDNRGKSEASRNALIFKEPLSSTNPLLASQWLEKENGMKIPVKITRTTKDEYWWKCPDCHHELYSSPRKRLRLSRGHTDEFITCPYCTLSKDAKIVYEFLHNCNIKFRQEYMFEDLMGLGNRKLRFDFAIFNDENKLASLIEFDGGYHDEKLNPDIENYKTTSIHDLMKDDYCVKNNIPLLRIHHSDSENIDIILSNYLLRSDIPLLSKSKINKNNRENISKIIEDYRKQKEKLQMELLKIDEKINQYNLMFS